MGSSAPQAADAPARPRGKRFVFVDLARAVTVLMMLQGHSLHVLLDPRFKHNTLFKAWRFVRGLTAPVFMFLSGFSFSIATCKRWDDQLQITPAFRRRIRRFIFFLFLGYAIHLGGGLATKIRNLDPTLVDYFVNVDVLQLIAASLMGLQFLVYLSRTPRRFSWAAGLLALLVVLSTPIVRGIEWKETLWPPLAAYLYSGTGSLFPAFGWSAFLLAGAALGATFMQHQPISANRLSGGFALLGLASAAIARLLRMSAYAGKPLFRIAIPEAKPRFLLNRFGGAMILISGFVQASRRFERLSPPIQALAEESLVVYVVHICLLYGSPWGPGIGKLIGHPLTPGTTLLAIVALMAAMTLMAYHWNQFKKGYPRGRRLALIGIGVALAIPIL